jgi:hypothetical protein
MREQVKASQSKPKQVKASQSNVSIFNDHLQHCVCTGYTWCVELTGYTWCVELTQSWSSRSKSRTRVYSYTSSRSRRRHRRAVLVDGIQRIWYVHRWARPNGYVMCIQMQHTECGGASMAV